MPPNTACDALRLVAYWPHAELAACTAMGTPDPRLLLLQVHLYNAAVGTPAQLGKTLPMCNDYDIILGPGLHEHRCLRAVPRGLGLRCSMAHLGNNLKFIFFALSTVLCPKNGAVGPSTQIRRACPPLPTPATCRRRSR